MAGIRISEGLITPLMSKEGSTASREELMGQLNEKGISNWSGSGQLRDCCKSCDMISGIVPCNLKFYILVALENQT